MTAAAVKCFFGAMVLLVALVVLNCSSWTAADTTATVKCVSRCAAGCIEEFGRAREAQRQQDLKACPAPSR